MIAPALDHQSNAYLSCKSAPEFEVEAPDVEQPLAELPVMPVVKDAAPPALRSVHTTSFVELLQQLGASVLVTTYQAGKLVVLRAEDAVLNTYFAGFNRPMGLAVSGDRLAIGTALEVWEYHNLPAVASQREPVGQVDACFLPRHGHVTGDIHIHEMAWVKFEDALREIFAVQVLPGRRFPDVNNNDSKLIGHAFVLPDDALADVPAEQRTLVPLQGAPTKSAGTR